MFYSILESIQKSWHVWIKGTTMVSGMPMLKMNQLAFVQNPWRMRPKTFGQMTDAMHEDTHASALVGSKLLNVS